MKNNLLLSVVCLLTGFLLHGQELAVYVSDAGNFNVGPWQIAKFDADGTFLGPLITSENDEIVWPQDIIFLEAEEAVLISNLSTAGIISKHDWATGDLIANFAEGLGGPTRMKVGPDGLLYVIQWDTANNKVLRYELNGTFLGEFTATGVPRSIGIAWDATGDLYVSSYSQSTVQKFNGTTGEAMGTFIDTGLNGPTNIFFEASGNMIVFSYNNGIIKRYDAAGNFIEDLITGLSGPEGFAFFPNGDMLIGNGGDGTVKRYDSNYNFIENFVKSGSLTTPNAIVIREDIPLSTPSTNEKKTFVIPTIGTKFRLNEALLSGYSTLEVYTISGALVETIVLSQSTTWDASHLAEGVYIIAGTQQGIVSQQRVLVQQK
ncbi:T9SS type A sorting domain-containing protein [Altibacter lentus]|uniref:T9SS type A sorting domain-containing protein n=1 Tax=Altibacter lentus TaxID=1223410 RepID=UPI0005522EC3|nr:T9SS type A sorting domain-containing protein [Altibacter lentus]